MSFALIRRRAALAGARAALFWERAAAVLWPALAFPTAFVVLALLGVWSRVGDPWRAIALVACALAAIVFAWRGLRAGRWPSARDARRRVEIDSDLEGRPFEALDDAPVATDPSSRALWRVHQARMREALTHVRARRPRAAVAARDVRALRGVLVLGALGGLIIAGAGAPLRVWEALTPQWLAGGVDRWDVQAWIAPPEYTRRAPIFLRANDTRLIEAPEGSELIVRVVGARRAPVLTVQSERGRRRRVDFEIDGPAAHAARAELRSDSEVRVAGHTWSILAVRDRAPGVAFSEEPEPGPSQQLRFSYLVEDDYGARTVTARFNLLEDPHAEPLEVELDAPPNARSIEETAEIDLTTHPWAGREVEMRIAAVDAIGQEGESEAIVLTLPERVFVDPLARAILEQRTALFSDDEPYLPAPDSGPLTAEDAAAQPAIQTDQTDARIGRAPDEVLRARRSLDLMRLGAAEFEDDPAVHLALAYAESRLAQARERAEFADLRDVLWDAAERAEGGDLADAERALREAERALARALARGDDPAEIERLMEEYREAVNRYLELLTLEALAEGRVLSDFSGGGMGQMGEDQLQAMLRALQELAETGSNDDARRALAALSEMLRNMQMQLAFGGGGGQGQPQEETPLSEALRDALEELAEVLGHQRETMDQTQMAQQGQRGQDGQQGQQGDGQQPQPGQSPGQSQGDSQGGTQGRPGGQPNAQPGGQNGALSERDPNGERGGGAPGANDPEFGPGFNQLLDRQREIRQALRELMDGIENGEVAGLEEGGEAGDSVDRAEDAMRRAERAMGLAEGELSEGDGEGALERQGQALEWLREGLENLAEGAQNAERRAAGLDENQASDQADRDPFGRNTAGGGFDLGDSVRVPDEMERRRAREILDELRERSGEADRPENELDYLRRLLERF